MKTIEILVIILMGFFILNHLVNTVQESFENKENGVDELIKQINKLNSSNSKRYDKVIKNLGDTSKQYDSLQKKLKSSNTTSGKMAVIKTHSSVKPLPPLNKTPPPPKSPTGKCPSNIGIISWPLIQEGMTSERNMEGQLQEEKVWSPAYANIQKTISANNSKLSDSLILIEAIEENGNLVQKTLQNNNF